MSTSFTNLPFVNTPSFKGTVVVSSSCTFGPECTVWQFATLCDDVSIGQGVVIGSNAWVGAGTVIGDFSRLQHGVFLPKNTKVGRYVFIGPNVTVCDDKYPCVGNAHYEALPPIFEDYCSIGAGSVILPGVKIGEGAIVGAGAVVTKNVPPHSTVMGCPAKKSHAQD